MTPDTPRPDIDIVPANNGDDLGHSYTGDATLPLPENAVAVYEKTRLALESATNDADVAIESVLVDIQYSLDIGEGLLISELSGVVGSIDNRQVQIQRDIHSIIDRVYETAFRKNTDTEVDLIGAEVGVPQTTDDMLADLADESGEWLFARLAGVSTPVSVPILSPVETATTGAAVAAFPGDSSILPDAPPYTDIDLPAPPLSTPPPLAPPPVSPPPPPPVDVCSRDTSFMEMYRQPDQITSLGTVLQQWYIPYFVAGRDGIVEHARLLGFTIFEGGVYGDNYTTVSRVCGAPPPPPPPSPPSPPSPPPPEDCECKEPAVPVATCDAGPLPPCTVPDKVPLPKFTPMRAPPGGLSWANPGACMDAAERVRQAELDTGFIGSRTSTLDAIGEAVTGAIILGGELAFGAAVQIGDFLGLTTQEAKHSVLDLAGKVAKDKGIVEEAWKGIKGNVPANPSAAYAYGTRLGAANRVELITGIPVSYLMQSDLYVFQWANPQYICSQPELDAQYLTQLIAAHEWECHTRAHGNHPNLFWNNILTKQARPNTSEIIQLSLRNGWTQEQTHARMREQGVLAGEYTQEYRQLAEFIPPYSDLIRMMVRDSADDEVARQYGFDKDFTNKFGPKIAKWASQQGIDANVFSYLWRAHWELPSYTQLSEMLFRLRPDRAEVVEWERAWGSGPVGIVPIQPPPRPQVVTLADVQQALEINDMAPTWVPRMVDIAYHPLTRTDAVRAFEIGTIDAVQLHSVLQDNGYSSTNADTLVRYYTQQKSRRIGNATGVWSIRKTVSGYKVGTVTHAEAIQLLVPLVVDPAERLRMLAGASLEVDAAVKGKWIAKTRRAYFVGEYDGKAALLSLTGMKVDEDRAVQLIDGWRAERDGRYKEATVRQLSKWAAVGVITAEDMKLRLQRLGYNDLDSNRIIYSVQYDLDAAAQRAYEKTSREIEKRFKDNKQAKKAAEEDLVKRLKELEKERERIEKEMNRRRGLIGDE